MIDASLHFRCDQRSHTQVVGPSTGPAQGSSQGPSTAQSACAVIEHIHSSIAPASIFLFIQPSLGLSLTILPQRATTARRARNS